MSPEHVVRLNNSHSIPDDILLHIFSFLPASFNLTTIPLVSKDFSYLSRCNVTDADWNELALTDEALESILQKNWPKLKSLSMVGCENLQEAKIAHEKIERLDISYTNLSNKSVEYLLKHCHSLKFLNLNGSAIIPGIHFSHEKLEEVHLVETSIEDEDVSNLLRLCPNLRKIDLSACAIENLKVVHPNLEEIIFSFTNINDEVIMNCCKECPNLKKLVAKECRKLLDLSFFSNSLIEIDISHCPIQKLELDCPNLEILNISHCNKLEMQALRLMHKNLKKLYMHHVLHDEDIVFDVIEYIKENCPKLIELKYKTKKYLHVM